MIKSKISTLFSFLKKKPKAFSLIELSIVILIIGLIVAGVIGGKKLVTLSNLSKARALTNSSPVNGIEDLVLWYETTSKNSFPKALQVDGTLVTSWYDINPQLTVKKNLSTTAYTQPVYTANGINGLPALINNASGCLATDPIPSSQTSPDSQNTVFVVGRDTDPAVFISHKDSWTNRIGELEIYNGNVRFHMANTSLLGNNSMTKDSIVTLVKDASNMTIYFNGAQDSQVADSSTVTPFASPQRLFIGCWDDTQGYTVNGSIGEIIMFSRALSDFERQQVEQYLSKKWGIKLS